MIRRVPFAGALVSLLSIACATAQHNAERSYVRPGLERLDLRNIDIALVAQGPPRVAGESLDVRTFDPPELDQPVFVGAEDEATHTALRDALGSRLRGEGFTISFLTSTSSPTPSTTTPTTTSTAPSTATSTAAMLREILSKSQADAVLIVRVVPVDAFSIDYGAGSRTEVTDLGRQRIQDVRPVARGGRLLLGQAFLFDRKTGLRLWTEQLPDFPESGRLTPDHPLLRYGFVHDPAQGDPPPPAARAKPAAAAFVRAMFDGFPKPSSGTPEGRASLEATDTRFERFTQSFFDRGHFVLEVGGGWGLERGDLDIELAKQPLPSLGSNAVAPNGVVRVQPRLTYVAAGGWAFALSVPFGDAPGSFKRSYYRDNPKKTLMDPDDRAASLAIAGTKTYGLELAAGRVHLLSRHLFLVPSGGAFWDVWNVQATPERVATDVSRHRVGGLGAVDLWIRPSEDGIFFGRVGAEGRIGLELSGPPIYGFMVSASVGALL